MLKKMHVSIESKISRLVVLSVLFILLLALRHTAGEFGVSIGYLYITFISLAGFWFGVRGGVTAAIFSCGIFLYEINIFSQWSSIGYAKRGIFLRFFEYFLSGITFGYLATVGKKMKTKMEELIYRDELTNCLNYRWTMKRLEEELDRARRYKKNFAVAMLDVDYFKKINDVYGHMSGNRVLQVFSSFMRDRIRSIDVLGRYGGDEFLVIFPEVDHYQALRGLNRIKEEMERMNIELKGLKMKEGLKVRFSAGIASFPYNGESINELLTFADNALYRAKVSGRDKVFVERRRWVRVEPVKDLKIEVLDPANNDKIDAGKVKNISQRGMLVILNREIKGEEFLCRIKFPGEGESSSFLCKVANKRAVSDKGGDLCSAGICFAEIPDDDEKKLKKIIDLALEKKGEVAKEMTIE